MRKITRERRFENAPALAKQKRGKKSGTAVHGVRFSLYQNWALPRGTEEAFSGIASASTVAVGGAALFPSVVTAERDPTGCVASLGTLKEKDQCP
ncbi:uncharacterized protein G2W53_005854 [Senna tora]|uniref:Uncharacterized protein n=1 Tax=Senna tora TaxID=362788 RepID=A0A834X4C0_9FABA|nr:uncharacterized protein G2W53_005854 [Senna tora]